MAGAAFGAASVFNIAWWANNSKQQWWKKAIAGITVGLATCAIGYGAYSVYKTGAINKEGRKNNRRGNRYQYEQGFDKQEYDRKQRDFDILAEAAFEDRMSSGNGPARSKRAQAELDAIEKRWRASRANKQSAEVVVGTSLVGAYGLFEAIRLFCVTPRSDLPPTPSIVEYAYYAGSAATLFASLFYLGFKPKVPLMKGVCLAGLSIMAINSFAGLIAKNPISTVSLLPKGVKPPIPTLHLNKEKKRKRNRNKPSMVSLRKKENNVAGEKEVQGGGSTAPRGNALNNAPKKAPKAPPTKKKESQSISPQVRTPPVYSVLSQDAKGRFFHVCSCFRVLDYIVFPSHAWDMTPKAKYPVLFISDGKPSRNGSKNSLAWSIKVEYSDPTLVWAMSQRDTGACLFPIRGLSYANKVLSTKYMFPPDDYSVEVGSEVIMFTPNSHVRGEVQELDPDRNEPDATFRTRILRHNGTTLPGNCGCPVVRVIKNSSTSVPTSYQLIGFHEEGANTYSKFNGVFLLSGIASFLGVGSPRA
jgi:hypothetical protein